LRGHCLDSTIQKTEATKFQRGRASLLTMPEDKPCINSTVSGPELKMRYRLWNVKINHP
jgi:hypothetical protein